MSWDLIQHALVTVVALAAAGVLLQRLGELFFWPKPGPGSCAQCPSARTTADRRGTAASRQPVVLHLHKPRKT